MDLIDILWNYSQEQSLREMGDAQATAHRRHTSHIQRLAEENQELRIRVGVLIRILIERGIFSAGDYDTAVKSVQAQLKTASTPKHPAKRTPPAAPRKK